MVVQCLYDDLIKVSDLKPHPKNRNQHPEDQIKRLADILKYQGWRYPVKVSKRSGFVISGHGRIEAARMNGWKSVPVNFQDYESDEQEYADVQADNAIASWAELDLSGINSDLADLGPDFDIDLLGIKGFEIDVLLPEPQCDEDEIPEQVEPKTKRGDIYQLGRHRLMCGDSTVLDDVEKLMAGEKADMVFTDPPYGMNLRTDYKDAFGDNGFRTVKAYKPVQGDDSDFDFLTAYALVESVSEQFWWGADYYCQQILKGGSWFVWNKRTSEGLERMYGNHFELCWSKVKHQREIAAVTWASAFGHNKKDDGAKKVHPTMKPVKLIEWFFERFKGQKVIDLFGGSGSTLIACEKTNRKCFMMELDPHYCDIIVARWEKYTGKKAELLNG
jgi:DNA modification methylase